MTPLQGSGLLLRYCACLRKRKGAGDGDPIYSCLVWMYKGLKLHKLLVRQQIDYGSERLLKRTNVSKNLSSRGKRLLLKTSKQTILDTYKSNHLY